MDSEEDIQKKHSNYVIGQELADLSVADLEELIGLLKSEIERLDETRRAKSEHLSAAEALFNTKA